jgi:hypothetical protein
MRLYEIIQMINEGRDAPLYHWMSAQKAARCFNSDRLRPLFKHKMLNQPKGISLTRNAHYTHSWADPIVRLTLNQRKLAQRYQIIPVDAEHAAAVDREADPTAHHDRNPEIYNQWGNLNKRGNEMAEEFLIGIIAPLHVYLDEIFLTNSHNDNVRLMNALPRYLRKFDVPFKTDDKHFVSNYMNKQ